MSKSNSWMKRAGLLLLLGSRQPAWGEALQAPPCLGQINSLASLDGRLFVGTQAGLMRLENEKLLRVASLPAVEIKSLAVEEGGLNLIFGDLSRMRLQHWDEEGGGFLKSLTAAAQEEDAQPLTFQGFMQSADTRHGDHIYTATLGGGLYKDMQPFPGLPARLVGVESTPQGLVVASCRSLFLRQGAAWKTLHRNPAEDCRITSLAEFQGASYAGTLSGGVLKLPNHEPLGFKTVLQGRVNCLFATQEELYVGTEAGMMSFDGKELRLREDITTRSVTSIQGDENRLLFNTTRGLLEYDFKTKKTSRQSPDKGFFMGKLGKDFYWGGMYGVFKYLGPGQSRRILHEYVTGFAELDGRLYISGYYNGLWCWDGKAARKVADGEFSSLLRQGGGLLLGTGRGKLFRFDPAKEALSELKQGGLPTESITSFASTAQGIFVGTPAGAAFLKGI